jgi:tellurite resistance protein TehA-like permease
MFMDKRSRTAVRSTTATQLLLGALLGALLMGLFAKAVTGDFPFTLVVLAVFFCGFGAILTSKRRR